MHYAKARCSIGTSSIAPGTHPGEPKAIPRGLPCAFTTEFSAVTLLFDHDLYRIRGGRRRHADAVNRRPLPKSPETEALNAYNSGVRLVEKADELSADAARQTDASKQKKALDKARKNYSTALRKFAQAIELQSGMYTAWNYLGYSQRKLGNYPDALLAYDRALSLKPGYAEAIEYRGHAYLGLNRLSEAKEAYLALYAGNRKLAASLLAAMQEWVGAHRTQCRGRRWRHARLVRIVGERAQQDRGPDRGPHARRRRFLLEMIRPRAWVA